MEGGVLSLEEMIARFEEGQRLIKLCTTKLNEVEKKVETLVKEGDRILSKPFDVDEVVDSGSAEPSSGGAPF
jgi:exodeoxyribonuclease VII small subunit